MASVASISSQFVPVFLGADRLCVKAARRLFFRHGLVSHLLAPRPSLLQRLTPWLICHRLPAPLVSDLTCLALLDLASDIAASDRTPLLYIGKSTERLPSDSVAKLERAYVLYHEYTDLPCMKGETLHE